MQFYKWLTPDHKGIYGHGDYTGFLPNGKPGKWLPKIARPEPCVRGYHAVTTPFLAAHLVADHAVLFEVETRGASVDADNKTVFAEIRLVRRVGGVDRPLATVFACECAERVLPIFERERPGDDRPRRAIEAARAWASNPCDETVAARAAVWAAAEDAATVAARAAARDAAWAAATVAARAAAWAAATDAATDAARAAARDAATVAARAAVRDAAEDAATDAARAAVWAAVWPAEREWQGRRLLELVAGAGL